MDAGKIFRIWMSLIGILFCVAEGKSENNLIFEAEKIVAAGIEMPYRVAHTNGMGNQVLVIYLHGGSSKGNDNDTQMKEAGIDSIANYLNFKNRMKCDGISAIKLPIWRKIRKSSKEKRRIFY